MIKKIAFALTALTFLSGPIISSAQALPPSGLQCPSLTLNLQRGSRDSNTGGQVSALQTFLADYFAVSRVDVVTGFFGSGTEGYVKTFQKQYGLSVVGTVGALTRAKIAAVCSGQVIVVTAPNGGEKWQEGVLNTVTWRPYQYNPDLNPARDVTAYLETKNSDGSYNTLGKVQESGKASIHWITGELNSATQGGIYAPAGNKYYIRVVNNVTGAWDRSDAPFTLAPKPVDLKINGSDGPITVLQLGAAVQVSWKAQPGVSTCQLGGLADVSYSDIQPNSGSLSAHIATTTTNAVVGINCVYNGATINDYVSILVGPQNPVTLSVLTPNGGELLDPTQLQAIRWQGTGISMASIAIYQNDKWYAWLNKSFTPTGKDVDMITFVPNDTFPMTSGLGAVWKAYVTGQRADGQGYIEDKSDAPFSFVLATSTPKGNLSIFVGASPAAQTVVAGSVGVTVGSVVLDATASSEDLRLSQIMPVYTDNITPDPTNCQAFDGATALNTGSNIINLNVGGGQQVVSFVFDNPLTVAKGTAKVLTIKCNIPSSVTSGSFNWGLVTGSSACAVGVVSNTNVCPIVTGSSGPTMTVASGGNGTLSVSTDASSPAYSVASAGSTGVMLGVYKFHATGEQINLTKIGLHLTSGKPSDLTQVYLSSAGGKILGTAVFIGASTDAIATLSTQLAIAKDTDNQIYVSGDIANIGTSQPGTSGDLIVIDAAASTEGVGQNSGTIIHASGTSANIAGVRIFKSYPTVSLDTLPSDGLPDGRLIRFKITANPANYVSIGALNFTQSTVIASVSNMALYAYTDSAYSNPVSGQGAGGLVGTPTATGNKFGIIAGAPLAIPAGQTVYFELRGTVSGAGMGSAAVTTLLGDSVYTGTGAFTSQKEKGSFTWSPNSTSFTQFVDSDWTNGFAIPGLPASGLSQYRSTAGGVTTCPAGTILTGGVCVASSPLLPTVVTPAPTCTITTDKSSYNYGEMIQLSWTTTDATYATWVPDTSGKDNFVLGADKLAVSGSATIQASVSGNPFVTMSAYGNGGTGTCTKVIPVAAPIPSVVPITNIKTTTDFVTNMYRCILGREPDAGGLAGWVNALKNHTQTVQSEYKSFFSSAEYLGKNTDNATYVNQLYKCVYYRQAEPTGVDSWLTYLKTKSRTSALDSVLGSGEFKQNILPALSALKVASEADSYANLANALTALESALQSLLAMLGQ